MEQNTKSMLAETIKQLIRNKPLDRITVTDIATTSGISRQTFYRHFIDKYDLVNWYFKELVMKSFTEMGQGKTLKEALVLKFTFIQSEHDFFREAFKSNDFNNLKAFDFECIYHFYKEQLLIDEQASTRQFDFLLQMYCKGSVEMTIEWILNQMPVSIDEITDLLIMALPKQLEEVFQFHNLM